MTNNQIIGAFGAMEVLQGEGRPRKNQVNLNKVYQEFQKKVQEIFPRATLMLKESILNSGVPTCALTISIQNGQHYMINGATFITVFLADAAGVAQIKTRAGDFDKITWTAYGDLTIVHSLSKMVIDGLTKVIDLFNVCAFGSFAAADLEDKKKLKERTKHVPTISEGEICLIKKRFHIFRKGKLYAMSFSVTDITNTVSSWGAGKEPEKFPKGSITPLGVKYKSHEKCFTYRMWAEVGIAMGEALKNGTLKEV